jgi:IclR family acetate operon transcriptional repressor
VTELSRKQLSERTGLYKSRILRLCGTLMAHGFLICMEGSNYRLGPKLMMLGKIYERSNPLVFIARPILP